MRVHWRCRCDEGWVGKECGVAVCDTEGCLNGECVAPDECVCYSGWGSNNCTLDQLTKEQATAYLDGLMVKVRKLPALVVHKNEEGYRDSWKCVLRVPAPPFHSCCSSHYFSLQLKHNVREIESIIHQSLDIRVRHSHSTPPAVLASRGEASAWRMN